MIDQNLHQQLLELVYDLLSTDEAAALLRASKRNRKLPRLMRKPSHGRSIAVAARTEAPRFMSAAGRNRSSSTGAADQIQFARFSGHAASRRGLDWRHRSRNVVDVYARRIRWQRFTVRNLAADHLRLVVTGPAKLEVACPISIRSPRLRSPASRCRSMWSTRCTLRRENHSAAASPHRWRRPVDVTIPASVPITGAARLEVLAYHHDSTERMQTFVPTEQRRFVSQLALDKPLYQRGNWSSIDH